MKRKEWFIVLAPLFFVWFTDHILKLWGESLIGPLTWGPLRFQLFHNHGAFLGFFAELPPLLRIVSLSTIGSFLVFSYAIIQYMLPIKSMRLRLGLSILLGGIIGNVYDRILWGYVVDFLIIDFSFIKTHPLNLADLYQWIGYGFIALALFREDQLLWPEQNSRKKLWIYPNYQMRYILFLLIITLSLTLIGVVFSYTYLKVTIFELIGENRFIPRRFLIPYVFTYLCISFTFCCFLFVIGRRVSHRNAGPIYAFDKYINDLLDGRNRRFKLRSGDEFKQLETLGLKIAEYLSQHDLIDPDDNMKTLTTPSANADDCTIPAVPVDDQMPNYEVQAKTMSAAVADRTEEIKCHQCPICSAPEIHFHRSPLASYLVECEHCGFVFDPSANLNSSSLYDDSYFTKERGQQGFANYELDHDVNLVNFRKRIQTAQKINPNLKSYLDIGCAFGDSLEAASECDLEPIHGVEISAIGCEKSRAKGFQVFQGTLEETLPSLKIYDLVMLSDVIEHVSNPTALINSCHAVLNPEGIVMIHTPNVRSWSARWMGKKWYHLKQHEHLCFFSEVTIQRMLEENGFNVLSIKSSTSYLSPAAIVRRLQIYGFGWAEKWIALIPKAFRERFYLPLKTGNMLVIASKKP